MGGGVLVVRMKGGCTLTPFGAKGLYTARAIPFQGCSRDRFFADRKHRF